MVTMDFGFQGSVTVSSLTILTTDIKKKLTPKCLFLTEFLNNLILIMAKVNVFFYLGSDNQIQTQDWEFESSNRSHALQV